MPSWLFCREIPSFSSVFGLVGSEFMQPLSSPKTLGWFLITTNSVTLQVNLFLVAGKRMTILMLQQKVSFQTYFKVSLTYFWTFGSDTGLLAGDRDGILIKLRQPRPDVFY